MPGSFPQEKTTSPDHPNPRKQPEFLPMTPSKDSKDYRTKYPLGETPAFENVSMGPDAVGEVRATGLDPQTQDKVIDWYMDLVKVFMQEHEILLGRSAKVM
jgi:hypothetical protein